jgi:hypothetical protein
MDEGRQKPGGAIGSFWAVGGSAAGGDSKQLDLWSAASPRDMAFKSGRASIGSGQDRRPPSIDKPSDDTNQASGAPQRAMQPASRRIDPLAIPPEPASAWDYEIRVPNPDEYVASGAPVGILRFRPALVAAALAAAIGLGWAGGWSTYRYLAPLPASAPVKQVGAADCAPEPGKEPGCASPKADREAVLGGTNVRKVPSPATTGSIRAPEAPRSAPQQAASVSAKEASAAAQGASSAKAAPRPVAVPETRPTTIEGWTIREVVGNTAILEGPTGVFRATPGDTVPGVGRIDSIVRWGSRWIVATSKGLISTPN